jgi:hypothetical protein
MIRSHQHAAKFTPVLFGQEDPADHNFLIPLVDRGHPLKNSISHRINGFGRGKAREKKLFLDMESTIGAVKQLGRD